MPSSASEFKKRRQQKQTPTELHLPSGLVITARRPAPSWFLFHASLPRTIVDPEPDQSLASIEEVVRISEWIRALLSEVVISPKISLNPGPDEITPEDIEDADLNFIVEWAKGEVKEVNGEPVSLQTFPEKRVGSGVGSDVQDVEVSPV